VLLVVLWVTLLAVADCNSTKHHFGRIRQGDLVERARLEAHLRRIRGGGNGNGKPSAAVDSGEEEP
jgi:hypothetical protein